MGWVHCQYSTTFGLTSGTVAQSTQYKCGNDFGACDPYVFTNQGWQSQCQQCGVDEYVDAATNSCKPKPGCSSGEQLAYCSNASAPREKKQLGAQCPVLEKNPVNSATGNKFQREQDYAAASGGLTFIRSYNSRSTQSSGLGVSWRHNWQASLTRYDSALGNYVVATRPDGQAYYFTLTGGNWVNEADIKARLTQTVDGYVLTDGPAQRETYDSQGRLIEIESDGSHKFTLAYTGAFLSSVSDRFGRTLTLAYDGQDLLATLTDPGNNVTSYDYDTAGNLASVIYPGNQTRIYHYEDTSFPNALTGTTDENGDRYATWTYDAQGRAVSSEHAGGADSGSFSYNGDGTTTITDSLGLTRTRSYTLLQGTYKASSVTAPSQSCGESAAATAYDANGFVDTRTDFNGNVTDYTHNSRGLEESRTEAFGTPLARTIATQWHTDFGLPTQIEEPGRKTTYSYDTNGNRLTETVTDAATEQSRTTTWTYTTEGLVDTVNGPRTDIPDITDYDYDASGNLIRITNALNHITEITSQDDHGNPLTIVDPNNVTTTLTYDERQRLKTRTVAGVTTTFTYDGVGQLDKVTLPGGAFLDYTYDGAHRLTDIEDNYGNRIHYTLDTMGSRTKEEVFDPSDHLKRAQSQVFDSLGRIEQIKNAANQVVSQYGYDAQGNRTTQTDAGTFTTTSTPDALNRIKQVTDAADGITQYDYNALDQLVSVTDPKDLTTSYTLNALGDMTLQDSPDTGFTVHTYDAAGNRKTALDARGVQVNYTYDKLNRLTAVDYPATDEDVAYSYDGTNYTAGIVNGVGRLTGITDESGTTTILYDARGNVTQETRVIAGTSHVTGYSYDSADRLTGISYPTGRSVSYERNSIGQVSKVTMTVGPTTTTVAESIAYMPFGGIKSYTLGNGIVVTRTHDQDYRLEEIKDQGTPTIQDLKLYYDLRGNIESLEDLVTAARSQTFGYDELSRLTSAEGQYGLQGFTYDGVGNRLTQTTTPPAGSASTDTYTYPGSSHRLSSQSSGASFGYDDAGAITAKGSVTLSYNNAHRPNTITGSASIANLFNSSGQRVKKTASGVTSVFHYDRFGHLLAETLDTGLLIKREYVWLEDLPLAVASERKIPDLFVDNVDAAFSQQGAWSTDSTAGQYGSNHVRRTPAVEVPGESIVDDTDSGASYTGAWVASGSCSALLCPPLLDSVVSGEAPYGSTYFRSAGSSPGSSEAPVFTWQVTLPGAGRYRVYVRWVPLAESGMVTYAVTHAAGTQSHLINQSTSSSGWYSLGSHEFGTTATITLTPDAGVTAVADAVRLVPIEDTDADQARWAAAGEDGEYQVYVRWPSVSGVSTGAPFEIVDSAGPTSLTKDQTADTGQWNLFGTFTFDDPATQGIKLGAVWDQTVIADAVHFVPVEASSHRTNLAYFHVDHLNTPQKMTDSTQAVVWDAVYGPFGEASITKQPFFDNPLRFPGQYFDAETGLHQNWYRDYDPSIGRYLQSDPIGLAGGLNTYVYVESNPIVLIDPAGLRGGSMQHLINHQLGRTYREMTSLNIVGSDQFFHCLAACRARKAGGTPEAIRLTMNEKEYLRDYPLGRVGLGGDGKVKSHSEMLEDIRADQMANKQGYECPADIDCNTQCRPYIEAMYKWPKSRDVMRELYQ